MPINTDLPLNALGTLREIDNTTVSVISLTEIGSQGANLTSKTGTLPSRFTYCIAAMSPALLNRMELGTLVDRSGKPWFGLDLAVGSKKMQTVFGLKIGPKHISLENTTFQLFPFQWIRPCISVDSYTGHIQIVVDGKVIANKVFQEMKEMKNIRLVLDRLYLGYFANSSPFGKFTNLQVFSSVLPIEKMLALTTAGSKECGENGDLLAWRDMQWHVSEGTKIETVFRDEPCNVVTNSHIYNEVARFLPDAKDHCRKIKNGHMVPVTTFEEYTMYQDQVNQISFDRLYTQDFFSLYTDMGLFVPITDQEYEGIWRDLYTGNK